MDQIKSNKDHANLRVSQHYGHSIFGYNECGLPRAKVYEFTKRQQIKHKQVQRLPSKRTPTLLSLRTVPSSSRSSTCVERNCLAICSRLWIFTTKFVVMCDTFLFGGDVCYDADDARLGAACRI